MNDGFSAKSFRDRPSTSSLKVIDMKEIVLTIALLFSFSLRIEGQSSDAQRAPVPGPSPFEHEDECGSPVAESMLWTFVEGKVIRVVDGDTIILLTKDNKRKRVNLVAVDASAGQDLSRNLLSELVLNQLVSVHVSNDKPSTVVGVVHTQEKDVNRELLEAGVARYHKPEFYSVSRYTACVYRIVEKEAKDAKRGRWQPSQR